MMIPIGDADLFCLRVAAAEWYVDHHDSPNAPAVMAALKRTNSDQRSDRPEAEPR